MSLYKLIGLVLTYPEADWIEALGDLRVATTAEIQHRTAARALQPLLTDLAQHTLLDAQERYVATFDQTPGQSLYLLEHTIGDGPGRGQGLVDLLEQYRKHGLEIACAELPDFVPLYLEFLSLLPPPQARQDLIRFQPVMETLASRLREARSPYAAAFDGLLVMARARAGLHMHVPAQAMRWVRARWSLSRGHE
ncbi:MAG: nitrate reductase molybdenum cofactor assembly chaperone [Nitrospiraceae bacterium]